MSPLMSKKGSCVMLENVEKPILEVQGIVDTCKEMTFAHGFVVAC